MCAYRMYFEMYIKGRYYNAINSTEILFSPSLTLFLSLYILHIFDFFKSDLYKKCDFLWLYIPLLRNWVRFPVAFLNHSDNPCAQSCSITSSLGNCEVTISRWGITYLKPWVIYMYRFLYCIKIYMYILYS